MLSITGLILTAAFRLDFVQYLGIHTQLYLRVLTVKLECVPFGEVERLHYRQVCYKMIVIYLAVWKVLINICRSSGKNCVKTQKSYYNF